MSTFTQGCYLPEGNRGEFMKIDDELGRRRIRVMVIDEAGWGRIYLIADEDLRKLPTDEKGPYLGDDNSGHSIYEMDLGWWMETLRNFKEKRMPRTNRNGPEFDMMQVQQQPLQPQGAVIEAQKMTPGDVQTIMEKLGINQKELAKELGVTRRSIYRYTNEYVPRYIELAMYGLVQQRLGVASFKQFLRRAIG